MIKGRSKGGFGNSREQSERKKEKKKEGREKKRKRNKEHEPINHKGRSHAHTRTHIDCYSPNTHAYTYNGYRVVSHVGCLVAQCIIHAFA